jgi:hypothetical protein
VNFQATWDATDEVSYYLLDDPTLLNSTLVTVDADTDHEAEPVALRIDYGLGDIGDRIEVAGTSGSMFGIAFYLTLDDTGTLPFPPVGYLATTAIGSIVTLTKVNEDEDVDGVLVDFWVVTAGQLELDV